MGKPKGGISRRPKKLKEEDLAAIDEVAKVDIQPDPAQEATDLATAEDEAFSRNDPATDFLASLFMRKEEAEITARELANEESRKVSERGGDLHVLRKNYTRRLFAVTIIWLLAVLMFVLLTGLKASFPFYVWDGFKFTAFPISLNQPTECGQCWKFSFGLTDKVLIAFITSTTATVVGIFIIVAKWLFQSESKKEEKPRST